MRVARWSLGSPYRDSDGWQLVGKIPVHYNVGHLSAAEGDTVDPDGRYLVSLNKWAIDRFASTGPLHPQNLQLIDISGSGEHMQLLYDAPVGVGEPHYAQMIKVDKVKSWRAAYPETGWNPVQQAHDEEAARPGEERVERRGNTVEIWMTAVRSHFTPERVEIREGDRVIWHITNIESAEDSTPTCMWRAYVGDRWLKADESVYVPVDASSPMGFNLGAFPDAPQAGAVLPGATVLSWSQLPEFVDRQVQHMMGHQ